MEFPYSAAGFAIFCKQTQMAAAGESEGGKLRSQDWSETPGEFWQCMGDRCFNKKCRKSTKAGIHQQILSLVIFGSAKKNIVGIMICFWIGAS